MRMHKVPQVDLADPSVEPSEEELHALMVAVRNSVVARQKEAQVRFRRRLERAIHGHEGEPMPPPTRDDHSL